MVIERRLNRQWKLTELSLKCACHSTHFSHWKVAESRISAKTEMWVFFLWMYLEVHVGLNGFYCTDILNIKTVTGKSPLQFKQKQLFDYLVFCKYSLNSIKVLFVYDIKRQYSLRFILGGRFSFQNFVTFRIIILCVMVD